MIVKQHSFELNTRDNQTSIRQPPSTHGNPSPESATSLNQFCQTQQLMSPVTFQGIEVVSKTRTRSPENSTNEAKSPTIKSRCKH